MTLQNGAVINNNGGTWNLSAGDAINAGAGAASVFNNLAGGVLRMNDLVTGAIATLGVPLANNGSLNVLSGTLNLNGAYSGAGAITIDGYLSVLNTNVPVTAPSLSLTSGGTLGGAGVLTIPAGGVMNMLSPSSTAVTLNGKTLVNNGTVNQGTTTAYTDLWMTNAVVNNNGIWNVGYYTYIVDMGGVTPSVFNNAGTLNINAGPLSSYISTVFNNTGTVNVNAYTSMYGSGSLGGVFNIGTQTLYLGGLTTGYTLADGVQFNGTTGSISNAGVLNVAGVATINLTGTAVVPALDNSGTLNLVDPLAPAVSSTLNLAGTGAILRNSGTINSSGLVGGRSLSATITQLATGVINVIYPLTLNGVNYPAGTVITATTVVVPPAGAPVVPPPVQQVIQQQAATVTTATTTAMAPPPTITPLVIINPIFITAPDPNMPMLVGPTGGTIGGEPGTFGGTETTEDQGEKEIGSEKPPSC